MRCCLAYPALEGELVVAGVEALHAALRDGLPGWPPHEPATVCTPDIDARLTEQGWAVRARSGAEQLVATGDAAEGANAVIGMLVDSVLERRPQMVCLHAAGIQVGAGAILCAGPSGAGKSSLALHLARRGYRCLGDDQILVDVSGRPQAVALGLALKARLPLPPSGGLARFVAGRIASTDANVAYLHLHDDEVAPFATAVPVRAIVVVRRRCERAGGDCALVPLSAGAGVARLLEQTTAPGASAPALIALLSRLVDAVPVASLDYHDSDHAAERVLAAHGGDA